jgi:flagellar biosynthesis/type III secretory pathway M-ring protein FliF/YscJ
METIDTNFVNSMTDRQQVEPPGKLRRLTVAAFVDLTPDSNSKTDTAAASGETATEPISPGDTAVPTADLSVADVESLIATAVGIDKQRGDEIKVVSTRLHRPDHSEVDLMTVQWWSFLNDLARNISLGIAALAAMIVAALVLRKMKPVTLVTPGDQRADDRARVIAELSERIRDNPETLKDIMAAWLTEPGSEASAVRAGRRAA